MEKIHLDKVDKVLLANLLFCKQLKEIGEIGHERQHLVSNSKRSN